MALSNIFREPRREITESAVGIAIASIVIYGDWWFACWFQETVAHDDKQIRVIGMLVGILAAIIITGLVFLTHWVGEEICDSLARRGLELRPKDRR